MKCAFLRWVVLASTILCASAGVGQVAVATGVPPFGSVSGGSGGPDIVNLGNLNAHSAIPVVNKAGRGMPFVYALTYDNSIWYPDNGKWQPVANYGWNVQTSAAVGYVQEKIFNGSCQYWDGSHVVTVNFTIYAYFGYVDDKGTTHAYSNLWTTNNTAPQCGPHGSSASAVSNDGSGITLNVGLNSAQVVLRDGSPLSPPLQTTTGSGTVTDSNGNQISTPGNGTFTDTLGTTALTVSGSAPTVYYQYTAPNGGTATVEVDYTPTPLNIQTAFNCPGGSPQEFGVSGVYLPTTIKMPDWNATTNPNSKYTFSYEQTPGYDSTYTTGRMTQMTLPTGATISYSYSGGDSGTGIYCADGSNAGMTRTVAGNPWTYSRSLSGSLSTTTVTSPENKVTTLSFQIPSGSNVYLETQRLLYDGANTAANLRKGVTTCYNGNTVNCTTTTPSLPITQQTVFSYLYDQGGANPVQSEVNTTFNGYGLPTETDEYDFGSPNAGPGGLLHQTLTSYAALGNSINDRPSTVTVKDGGGNVLAQTSYSYSQAVTGTTGTPQLVPVTGDRGNPTTITYLTQGSTTFSKSISYFDTGNVQTVTDVNTAGTTYSYGACGNSFPTSVSLPLSLSRSMQWNCTGAVMTQFNDENNQPTVYTYNDAYFWRINSTTDPLNNVTSYSYTTTTIESTLNFNGGTSAVDVLTTVDGLGRISVHQKRQSPGNGNFDSSETDYDSVGRILRATVPYVGTASQTGVTTVGVSSSYDGLDRPATVSDSGGGSTTYSYTQNDVLVTVGPAPGGENTKRKQFDYDGLGRLKSVCELTVGTGYGTCSQTVAQNGYWTKYAYDFNGTFNRTTVTQNAQSGSTQTRTYLYDLLGRLISETNPESGTTTYTYDSDATCGTSNGDLVKRTDAVGNVSCYQSDAIHRVIGVTYPSGHYAGNTPSKTFVYDSATVNGIAMGNAKTRLAEAYTGPAGSKITDLGFSYTARGEVSDVYESTAHSGGYYHSSQSYWASGAPYQLAGPGIPTITYSADGEGRTSGVSASSGQNPITGTSYNVASLPTGITFGSADSDGFSYDSNTNRMTQYQLSVNGASVTGALTWNANGSLYRQAITDAINSSNSHTCTYSYDDIARIAGSSCGSVWNQTFWYDPFGNISKSGSSAFSPTYNTSTNQISSIPGAGNPTYDSDGNLANDTAHTYGWDSDGKAISLDSVGQTYDALGRAVEQNRSGSYTQIVYSPLGDKLALMTGSTLTTAFVPLPAGATAVYNSSGLSFYRHADWLGSSRLSSTTGRGVYGDIAYAPFGETYDAYGTTDAAFTGENQDTLTGQSGLYDFLFREYRPVQSRWISPDPAGLGAVDFENPQSFNRYEYVLNNPLAYVDPDGTTIPSGGIHYCVGGIGGFAGGCDWICPGPDGYFTVYGHGVCYGSGTPGEGYGGGGGGGSGNAPPQAPPANNRVPNKITCNTVLPNGRTVGSYVRQLSNSINQQAQVAPVSTPHGPAPNPSLPSPRSVAKQVFWGTNFRATFGGPGANYAFLGDAGNFAYGAVSANLGVPLWFTEAVAGYYSITHHPSSDWGWPWGMDPSAQVQVPVGYNAQCK